MTASDRGGHGRRVVAAIAFSLVVVALAVGGLSTVARSVPFSWVPIASDDWAMATSFTDFGIVAYGLSLLCLGAALVVRGSRLRLIAGGIALALTVLHASWIVPWFIADSARPGPSTPVFRILALNLRLGQADPAVVVGAATGVDIMVLTEATESARKALLAAGLGDPFPYERAGDLPATGANGTTVFSRFPIIDTRPGCRPASPTKTGWCGSTCPTPGRLSWPRYTRPDRSPELPAGLTTSVCCTPPGFAPDRMWSPETSTPVDNHQPIRKAVRGRLPQHHRQRRVRLAADLPGRPDRPSPAGADRSHPDQSGAGRGRIAHRPHPRH